MSGNARWQSSRLREKYARTFGIPLDDVVEEQDGWPDRYFVFAPKHPELPRWGTGTCP